MRVKDHGLPCHLFIFFFTRSCRLNLRFVGCNHCVILREMKVFREAVLKTMMDRAKEIKS